MNERHSDDHVSGPRHFATCRLVDLRSHAHYNRSANQIYRIGRQSRRVSGTERPKTAGNSSTGTGKPALKGNHLKASELREIVLAEILDVRPDRQWSDVAGLDNAKQVEDLIDCVSKYVA